MKVEIDHDLCSGDGICADLCPEVFEMTDEDKAKVIVDVVPEDLEEDVRDAAESCPEGCINIIE
jgi:ferredoxin